MSLCLLLLNPEASLNEIGVDMDEDLLLGRDCGVGFIRVRLD